MSARPAAFVTDLYVKKMRWDRSADKRGTWCTTRALRYYSAVLGCEITVPRDFVTDFASVPRIPVAFLFMGNQVHEAAVVHDWLYTVHKACGRDITRAEADAVFEEACIACGSYKWKAGLFHLGVEVGGAGPWNARGQAQVQHVTESINAINPAAPTMPPIAAATIDAG